MSKLKIFLSVQLIRQFTCDLTPISIQCKTTFCWTKFFGRRKYLSKMFFRFFRISAPSGSGKPGASILGESLSKKESNDTSSIRIGPAVPPTHPSLYSYFNPICCTATTIYMLFGRAIILTYAVEIASGIALIPLSLMIF